MRSWRDPQWPPKPGQVETLRMKHEPAKNVNEFVDEALLGRDRDACGQRQIPAARGRGGHDACSGTSTVAPVQGRNDLDAEAISKGLK